MTELAHITASTRVTFPGQATEGESRIVLAQGVSPVRSLVITQETPFYPISHSWPDQQADLGEMEVNGNILPVVDVLTAAVYPVAADAKLYVDKEIPIRKPAAGWLFLVAHIVEFSEGNLEPFVNETATLRVNEGRRLAISATHTATHLAALALNKSSRTFWTKDAEADPLGHPNLDKMAMQRSTISPAGCTNHYRFGKSMRKQGFDSARFIEHLGDIETRMNAQIEEWRGSRRPVKIVVSGPALESLRWWVCDLDDKEVRFPCGGTHLDNLGQLAAVKVSFEPIADAPEIRMRTVVTLQS